MMGEIFDFVSIWGICLYSDSCMLFLILVSFVFIIYGVVNINVKVIIMQGGYKIYEMMVLLGVFVIDDLSLLGYGSDFIVIIEEFDGLKWIFL